ncbi:hypothetical protein D1007_18596 [Hordeum vulgare]|nr:hypothetical protein D1007_18596 [Hordeum vulgare]
MEEAPVVVNQETMNEASPDCFDSDGDGSGGSPGPPGTPAITSRLSLLKIGVVISKFSDFKKELVRETGFDGLLHIKSWQKINLKYSAYLMDRVDMENSIINLESQGMLELKTTKYIMCLASQLASTQLFLKVWSHQMLALNLHGLQQALATKVLVLDSLDLDVNSKPHGVYPRIALFDYDSMKKMVDGISANMGGGEISYHRSSQGIVCVDDPANNFPRPTPTQKRAQFTSAPVKRASYTKTGPLEFANHIRTKYPTILGMILNEHNARGLAHISEMRQSFESTMFNFVDKLVSCIADNCTCCKAFGRKECRLKNEDDIDAENAPAPNNEATVFLTPISNKINTRLKGIFANEGRYSGNSSNARKRNCVMGSSNATESQKKICVSPNEPIQVRTPSGIDILNNSSISAKDGARNQVADVVYSFFDDLTASIVSYYAELRPSSNYITFGTTNDVVPSKIRLPKCKLARDPWSVGSVPLPSSQTVLRTIKDWFLNSFTINTRKVNHLLFLYGNSRNKRFRDQLTFLPKSHILLVRGIHANYLLPMRNQWIAHPKPRLICIDGIELHQQLAGIDQLSHEVGAIIFRRFGQMDKFYNKDAATMIWRKFLEPDFATAVLSNADPLTIQSIRTSFTDGEADLNPASSRLIEAELQTCFIVFCHRYNYGAGTTFLAWNFDGEKFQIPVMKDNLERHKNWVLYEVMRTDSNESMIPSGAIEAIKGSFLAL